MNLLFYQIIVFVLGFMFVAKALSHFVRKEQTIRELIAIILFWGAIFVFTIAPQIFEKVAIFLGFKEYINGLFIAAFVVLFYTVFKLVLKADKQQKQLTQLVRKLAIEKIEKTK